MKKFSKYIAEHSKLILIISLILIIPAIIGYVNTRINYDILVYLPENIETIEGENILTEDFGLGAYAFVMTDSTSSYKMLKLEEQIKQIDGVNQVFSIADIIDTTIPMDMLPSEITSKLNKDNETIIMVTFDGTTSEDKTIEAVRTLRETVDDASKVSSMTAMVIDTMDLSNQEIFAYVLIAVLFCIVILILATDSYIIPILLLSNIGIAILYNMGSNIFLGEISYITQAITAILQLGVTTDFSIFLYHKYEQAKEDNKSLSKKEAMAEAITQTFKSVIGSSLTTFAGFLALCTMDLTLGSDIGIVMAKGVLWGLICVLTLFPALLLAFDKIITKTKHKMVFPQFTKVQVFCTKHYKGIIVAFIILLIPAYIGNSNYDVYYKLDESLPQDLAFNVANSKLAENFNIISPEIILINKNIKSNTVQDLVNELKNIEGVDLVLAPSTLMDSNTIELLPKDITKMLENDSYQLIILNSTYAIASDQLNEQVEVINDIVKKYDESGIIAGEGPLMKDLVTIADHDFRVVNYTSIAVIFIIMVLVLKQIGLPIILVIAIEFAIFINMAIAYFTGTSLPFIASIVVGTIQLGATIDYAILMSTKYLELRTNIKDKKEAMQKTLSLTVTSIITSALCFFAATFGVAVYTKIDMIGSICELLARGSIISMLVVILILPSLLIVFDRFIVKQKKEGKNMKKVNKAIALGMLSLVLVKPASVLATTKTETIYSHLDYTGNAYKTVVNNHLYINDKKEFQDETMLTNILNLNGEENFSLNGNNLIWNTLGKDIFYQGTTDEKLPIFVRATYYLDDKEMDVKDLIGKKGNVKIELKFLNNTYLKSKDMYVPFVVAVGTVLDSSENRNIEVVNGKSVDTGSKNYVLGLASPGLYDNINLKEFKDFDKVIISYETSSFSLNDIYIVATPKLLEESDFAIFDKISELNTSIKLIQENMDKLEAGAKALEEGSSALANGSSEINANLKTALAGLKELEAGSKQLDNGLKEVIVSLKRTSESLQNPELEGSLASIQTLIQKNNSMIEYLKATDPVNNGQLITLLESNNQALMNMLNIINNTSIQVNNMLELLQGSMLKLEAGASSLNSNLTKVKNGVSALYQGSISLKKGANELNTGTTSLYNGISMLNKNGINVLSKYAANANNYSNKARNMIKLSKDYNGFGSNNADKTTFIYKISN